MTSVNGAFASHDASILLHLRRCKFNHYFLVVPIIESPFFADIAASDYFAAHEKKIAADLNQFGFAILPGFFSEIQEQAKQIRADLQPLYDAMAISTTLTREEIEAEARIQDAYRTSQTVKDIACDERITKLLTKLYGRHKGLCLRFVCLKRYWHWCFCPRSCAHCPIQNQTINSRIFLID
jgi:hypothetical protein